MALTSQILNQVMGYGATSNIHLNTFVEDHPDLEVPLLEIIDALTTIDDQLTSARDDSMAEKVGELEVNYAQHVAHLKSEGSRLLRQLEALTEVPLRFDKYRGNTPRGSTSTSVISYW